RCRPVLRLLERHRSGRDLRKPRVHAGDLGGPLGPTLDRGDVLVGAEPRERDVGQLHRVAVAQAVVGTGEHLVPPPAVENPVSRQGVRRDHDNEHLVALVGGEGAGERRGGHTQYRKPGQPDIDAHRWTHGASELSTYRTTGSDASSGLTNDPVVSTRGTGPRPPAPPVAAGRRAPRRRRAACDPPLPRG